MLKNFPDEYKSNDYAKFYEEMKFDLNEAIQKINYISLSQIGNKYRYAENISLLICEFIKDDIFSWSIIFSHLIKLK